MKYGVIVIIGIIENTNKRIEACRVFNSDTESFMDISYEKVKDMVSNGQRIVGLKLENRFDYYSGTEKKIVKTEKGTWNIKRVTRLNGAGQLIDDGKEFSTVIGWTGFAEVKRYYIVSWNGIITKLNVEEFKSKVVKQEINGAYIDTYSNKLVVCKDLNIERSGINVISF